MKQLKYNNNTTNIGQFDTVPGMLANIKQAKK